MRKQEPRIKTQHVTLKNKTLTSKKMYRIKKGGDKREMVTGKIKKK